MSSSKTRKMTGLNNSKCFAKLCKTPKIFQMVRFKFILSTWFEVLSSEILCLCIESTFPYNNCANFQQYNAIAFIYSTCKFSRRRRSSLLNSLSDKHLFFVSLGEWHSCCCCCFFFPLLFAANFHIALLFFS